MDKTKALEVLERHKAEMLKQYELGVALEKELTDAGLNEPVPFGPRNDIEYAQMVRELKESENGE